MKVDFMKVNESKANKKISFLTCASVLVIQAVIFGFHGSAEAIRGEGLAHLKSESGDDAKKASVQGSVTSGADFHERLKEVGAQLKAALPWFSFDHHMTPQIAALPVEDGASLVMSRVLSHIEKRAIINDFKDPTEKLAAAFLISKGRTPAEDPCCHKAATMMIDMVLAGHYPIERIHY